MGGIIRHSSAVTPLSVYITSLPWSTVLRSGQLSGHIAYQHTVRISVVKCIFSDSMHFSFSVAFFFFCEGPALEADDGKVLLRLSTSDDIHTGSDVSVADVSCNTSFWFFICSRHFVFQFHLLLALNYTVNEHLMSLLQMYQTVYHFLMLLSSYIDLHIIKRVHKICFLTV